MKTFLKTTVALSLLTMGTVAAQEEEPDRSETMPDARPVLEQLEEIVADRGEPEKSSAAMMAPSSRGGLILFGENAPVLTVQLAPYPEDQYWRRYYIHPLFAPSQAILTEDAPEDHPHHRGIFTAWRRIHIDGQSIGDSWSGEHVHQGDEGPQGLGWAYGDDRAPHYDIKMMFHFDWYSDLFHPTEPFMRETMRIRADEETADGLRKILISAEVTALTPGLQLGGTDDEQGYGGMSFRFAHADKMDIESDGATLTATNAAMQTGETVTFLWDGQGTEVPPDWPQEISIACTVNGEPWTNWVLRQELSMQNCAWPGNTMADIPMDEPVVIEATITIRQ